MLVTAFTNVIECFLYCKVLVMVCGSAVIQYAPHQLFVCV